MDHFFGAGNDLFRSQGTAKIDSATINLGKGADTFSPSSIDVSTGSFAGSTINGAGADFVLGSASIANGDTVAFTLDTQRQPIPPSLRLTQLLSELQPLNLVTTSSNTPRWSSWCFLQWCWSYIYECVITFTSTYNNDVTARYSAVAANASTEMLRSSSTVLVSTTCLLRAQVTTWLCRLVRLPSQVV